MKKIISFLLLSIPSIVFSQVNMEIGNNLLVETSGNTFIELSGNLIEANSGYLRGIVKSTQRTNETEFAGLQFTTGFTGTITRVTNSQYSKGNGEGNNFNRYYELNNTTGAAIVDDITVEVKTSGASDESNSLPAPYFLYTYNGNWQGYGDGINASPVTANNVAFNNGSTDIVISSGTGINAKIYLAGAYTGGTPPMSTALNSSLPTTSPYNADARTVSSIPTDAVDWVLVELRESANGPAIAYRSAFLKNNGMLISDNGSDGIGINAKPGDYFIVLKHRNHLPVMSATAQVGLTWGVLPALYDFTTSSSQFYGGNSGAAEL